MLLLTYNYLSQNAISARWVGWNLVPKFHVMDHMLYHVRRTFENPSFTSCFCDEDFVGRIALLSSIGRLGVSSPFVTIINPVAASLVHYLKLSSIIPHLDF